MKRIVATLSAVTVAAVFACGTAPTGPRVVDRLDATALANCGSTTNNSNNPPATAGSCNNNNNNSNNSTNNNSNNPPTTSGN